jgi:hypothetical protein
MGYFAEEYPMGYYGEDYSTQGYGEVAQPYGYYAEDPYQVSESEPVGYYGQVPEMVGYGPSGVSGYVRATRPKYNACCPMPTNVNGVEEAPLEGYTQPAPVSPTCNNFTSQPGEPIPLPDNFKPLW